MVRQPSVVRGKTPSTCEDVMSKFPVVYEGKLDELNNRWQYTVRGESFAGCGVWRKNCVGFVGTLAWAKKQARRVARHAWRNIEIVGLPCAGARIT